MEEVEGVVKHVVLSKFKEELSADDIESLIKEYANLVNLIEPMKSFQWGCDVGVVNMHQGFTHIFESTFESVESVSEYIAHAAHVEFADKFFPAVEKVFIFDYKPTIVPI
ncbi:hypothetical protein QQ045_024289 [Rhodiola kirilowii]